jgi:hypothetical protein
VEWRKNDEQWCFHMLDAKFRLYPPVRRRHYEETLQAFADSLVDQGLPPIV